MVLFLFVIMLVNIEQAAAQAQFNRHWWLALACAIGIGAEILYVLARGGDSFPLTAPAAAPQGGNTELIANSIFRDYLVPFELASVLLLAAIVGSVIMAKKRV
jgi:NADH-quinone oxidoreductase subunit J